GRFTLASVPGAIYTVTVRRIGFAQTTQRLALMDRDTSLVLDLVSIATALDTVTVVARQAGISGIVGDSRDLRPLDNARIVIAGTGRSTTTDADGRFFVPVTSSGSFLIRISRDGYDPGLVPVVFERGEHVETSALLGAGMAPEPRDAEGLWREFDTRLQWRGVGSALVPQEELERYDGTTLSEAVIRSPSFAMRGLRLGRNTCVFVNGAPRPETPLDAFNIEDVVA